MEVGVYVCGWVGVYGVDVGVVHEEEDQGSSWKSGPEGKRAEELASLEAPDDEGEWCWPRKNRITTSGKRVDPRPAFHYLAEGDEDEHVSGGLNHLVPRNAGGAQ